MNYLGYCWFCIWWEYISLCTVLRFEVCWDQVICASKRKFYELTSRLSVSWARCFYASSHWPDILVSTLCKEYYILMLVFYCFVLDYLAHNHIHNGSKNHSREKKGSFGGVRILYSISSDSGTWIHVNFLNNCLWYMFRRETRINYSVRFSFCAFVYNQV